MAILCVSLATPTERPCRRHEWSHHGCGHNYGRGAAQSNAGLSRRDLPVWFLLDQSLRSFAKSSSNTPSLVNTAWRGGCAGANKTAGGKTKKIMSEGIASRYSTAWVCRRVRRLGSLCEVHAYRPAQVERRPLLHAHALAAPHAPCPPAPARQPPPASYTRSRKRAVIYFGLIFFLISSGSPHVRPWGVRAESQT